MELDLELMLQNLNASSTDDRKYGINKFLQAIKNYYQFDINENNSNSIKILFSNQIKVNELFAAISRLLRDPDWKIRKDTFEILIYIITKDVLKDNIDLYMSIIIKHLIKCLSDSMMTVRKSATQCLHEYLNKSKNFEKCMQEFVEYGLSNNLDIHQRSDNNQALQVVLTPNFSDYNFTDLITGVLNQLNIEVDDKRIEVIVVSVLKSIRKLVGEERYLEYGKALSPDSMNLFNRCLSTTITTTESQSNNTTPSPWNGSVENGKFSKKFPSLTALPINETLHYGFIPQSIINDINKDRKLEAIEDIDNRLKICNEKEMRNILPHLEELLKLILALMEDNYLVFITTFKLLIDIVSCVPSDAINKHLELLLRLLRVALASNSHGDTITQKYTMTYAMILFQKSDTKELLKMLCDSQFMMDNKQPSIRQMSIDIVTSALLKFPSTKFDLDFISGKVCQRLLDKKAKVKLAALECISVIGYNYGNGKINTLHKIVDQVAKGDSINISEMVQSRLSKHRLPNIDEHGIVIYITDAEKFTNQRQQSIIDLENSSSDNSPISSANPLEKRRPSAGKVRGRAKFPWDQNEGNTNNHKSIPLSKAPGQNQIYPSDVVIQYSQGPLTVSNKELINEGRTIRKFNDLQQSNSVEGERISSKSQPISGRSYSSDNGSYIHTSGYSSGSNTFRNNYENMYKNNYDSSTATNSNSVTPRNNPPTSRQEDSAIETSPIPTKPALGRSAGSRRKENEILNLNSNNITDKVSSDIINETESQEIMNSQFLQGVRNSASKKKALKLFKTSNQNSSSNSNFDPDIPLSEFSSINGKTSQENINSQNVSNPNKGATFKANPQYSAVIVGKSVTVPPTETYETQPVKKKQPIKGMLDTSNGNVTQRSIVTNNHNEMKKNIRSEFPSTHNVVSHPDIPPNTKNLSRSSMIGQPILDFNNSIIGIGLSDKLSNEDDSDEEPNKGIMSNTLRESLSLKRQKVANELHSSKSESNIIPPAPASYSAPGSGSHQTVHRKPPAGGYYFANNLPSSAGNEREITIGYETVPPSRKPLRPALGNSTPKKIKPASQIVSNTQSNNSTDSVSINPTPLNNPEKSINESLSLIQNEDWEIKIAAMITIQCLVQFHTEILLNRPSDIHAIVMALCRECKNLRSQVAKCAIQTVGLLFVYLRKNIDSVLENIVSNLLSKAGEGTNSFLKQDVENSLLLMIENVSPNRAFNALLHTGYENRNIAIRRLTAFNMMLLCDKLGAVKIFSCIKEIPDKILLAILKFSTDGNQETRYYGKKMLLELNKHPDFDKLISKHLPAKDLRELKDILENIKVKGIGDPSQFSHSAGMQRSGSLSRGGSAGNLVALGSKSSTLSRGNSRSMIRLPGSDLSDDDKDWLTKTSSELSSSDFRIRQSGLESILNKEDLHILPLKSISKLLKDLIPRLNDNNTKVTVCALDVCQRIIPVICSNFPTEFYPEFINTIALNFQSKSIELRNSASNLMDTCFKNFDQSLLIQPCIEAINKSNPKTKPILIENMNKLLTIIESTKTSSIKTSIRMIINHVIPQISLLLEKNRSSPQQVKEQIQNLVVLSYRIVGPDMIDSAAQRGDHTLKQAIIDIVNLKNLNNTQ